MMPASSPIDIRWMRARLVARDIAHDLAALTLFARARMSTS
jgi:hypothetical protein